MAKISSPRPVSWPARSLLVVALAGLGWAAGLAAGRLYPPQNNTVSGPSTLTPKAPAAALARSWQEDRDQLLQQQGGLDRRLALLRMADQVNGSDRLELLKQGMLSIDEASRLVQAWAGDDPAACWAWQVESGMQGVDFTNTIFEIWAKNETEVAVAAVRSAPPGQQGSAAEALFTVWMRGDTPAAEKLAPLLDELSALAGTGSVARWGITDQDGKISARILTLPQGPARTKFLSSYAAGLFDKDWQQAAAWAAKLPPNDRAAVMEGLVQSSLRAGRLIHYSGPDRREPGPERQKWALQWLETEADDATRRRMGDLYVSSLASSDPAKALSWAQETMSGLPLGQAVAKVISSLATTDRTAAATLIEGLPPGGVRFKASQALMEKWLIRDAPAAMDWLRAQGNEGMDASGWDRIAGMWSHRDGQGFKNYVASHPEALTPAMLASGLDNLVRKDAGGTMAWAASFPEAARPDIARQTFANWASSDPLSAAQYVSKNPAAPVSAANLEKVTSRLFTRDPETAVDWAVSLPPGPARDNALTKLRETIPSHKDPVRREAWLNRLVETVPPQK